MQVRPQIVTALAIAVYAAGFPVQAPSPVPAASPFVGTWILNVAKSTYEGIPEPQRRTTSVRTLDVYNDGYFVQTHRNVSAVRPQSFSLWVGKPDGPDLIEFSRLNGTASGNHISIKAVGNREWRLTFKDQRGDVVLTDTWTVAPDGRTLTIDRRDVTPNRPPTHSVEVYDNEEWAMPRRR
jgi:hypothetical protein